MAWPPLPLYSTPDGAGNVFAIGQMDDGDSEPIIENSKEELEDIAPRAEEALVIAIPIAKRCYCLLKAVTTDLDVAPDSSDLRVSLGAIFHLLPHPPGARRLERLRARQQHRLVIFLRQRFRHLNMLFFQIALERAAD